MKQPPGATSTWWPPEAPPNPVFDGPDHTFPPPGGVGRLLAKAEPCLATILELPFTRRRGSPPVPCGAPGVAVYGGTTEALRRVARRPEAWVVVVSSAQTRLEVAGGGSLTPGRDQALRDALGLATTPLSPCGLTAP